MNEITAACVRQGEEDAGQILTAFNNSQFGSAALMEVLQSEDQVSGFMGELQIMCRVVSCKWLLLTGISTPFLLFLCCPVPMQMERVRESVGTLKNKTPDLAIHHAYGNKNRTATATPTLRFCFSVCLV